MGSSWQGLIGTSVPDYAKAFGLLAFLAFLATFGGWATNVALLCLVALLVDLLYEWGFH